LSDRPAILFVDDDPKAGELILRFCEDSPYACHVFRRPEEALHHFGAHGADLIVTDQRMPGMSGTELLAEVRRQNTEVPVIIITGYSTVESAVDALRLGATDFIKKPFDMDELLVQIGKTLEAGRLRQENRLLRRQLKDERTRYGMVGRSPAMQRLYATVSKVADIRCNVIIEGESGTGKELAARALHGLSQDAERPFIVIDCGALSDALLESELFGHEKGAFTGAAHTKKGLLEVASGGTVFLDEICNISDHMQVKLLRVVQEQQITRVGGVRPIDIDVRFVCATNRDLESLVRAGRFRHDLYHRLNVVTIRMPPMRERRDDIPVLVRHFIDQLRGQYQREVQGFDAGSMERLCAYSWPGNVRELRNLIERHIVLADGPLLHLEALPDETPLPQDSLDADTPTLEVLERRYIEKVLAACGGNRERTARVLGINKTTLWRKLQQYAREDGPAGPRDPALQDAT
jgi:DNA-binding NtrC family response regulator